MSSSGSSSDTSTLLADFERQQYSDVISGLMALLTLREQELGQLRAREHELLSQLHFKRRRNE
jgi:hypothetical protein